ncbi:hypothetical protein FPOAC2_10246 [Fusarium poae]
MQFFKGIHDDDEKAFETEADGNIQNVNEKWDAAAWLNRCGWPRHLEGIDPNRLRALLRPIGDDEHVLQRMWEIFEQVLEDAYDATMRECYPGTAELFEIARKEIHITTTKPFQGLMEPDAWERYKSRWRQLLCIWKRYDAWVVTDTSGGSDVSTDGDDSSTSSGSSSNSTSSSRSSSPSVIGDSMGPRPPYKMTRQQEEAWNEFNHGVTQVVTGGDIKGRYTPERLQRSCLDAVVQFLDHPFKNGNHYDSIVISALAVMGLGEGGGWMPVVSYTTIYSAVIKVARYLVLYQSILERQGQVRQLSQWGSKQQAEEDAEGLFQIVRRKVRRFMVRMPEGEDAQPSPMNWIINTRTYGMQIRYSTPGSETIDWRGDQIIHGRVRIRMSEISDMLHGLVGEARQTLLRLTSGRVGADDGDDSNNGNDGRDAEEEEEEEEEEEGEKESMQQWPPSSDVLPFIPWSKIQDRHGESTLEHSFLRDEENQCWVKKGEGWVRDQIETSVSRGKIWLARPLNEQCPYQEQAIRGYSRLIEQFRSQLFMLMHMLGGQPARLTEILGLRMWNTMNGGVRNIFIHEGMVCFVTMYHKGFRQTDKVKVIHRYLQREVGELLVWYMWLVLPFWQKVQRRMKMKNRRSAFLWADEVVSKEGQKESKVWHVKVRKGGLEQVERQKAKEEEAAFMDWFREPKWTSDRVRRVLQRYSTQFSGQEINISAWRQMATGISNRYLNKMFKGGHEDSGGGGELGEDDEGDRWGGDLVNSIQDLQAGHGSHIAGLIYARLFGQGEFGTMRSRDEFRKASMQWHRFFGFGAEDRVEQLGGKRIRCGFDDEREEMRRKRFSRLHRIDLKGQLGQMMGPSATFRGLQESVIRAVARGEWPIVQVTPTGGGKSLTFMLPAYCTPDGVTVVITPLVALEDDMAVRCAKLGIDAYVWKSRGIQRAASLVFVTPESAVSKGFRAFVERMHGQQKLDRVVVDECHTVLGGSKTFRPQMARLGEVLQDFGVPVICLTATLKPAQEMEFFKVMRFMPQRVIMFREPTRRKNIEYRVVVIEDGGGGGEGEVIVVVVVIIIGERQTQAVRELRGDQVESR